MSQNVKQMSSPYNLLSYFLSECDKQFQFLEEDFESFGGLSVIKKGRQIIVPLHNNEKLTQAVMQYERDDICILILYSADRYDLECYMLFNRTYKVHIYDVLKAAKKSFFARRYFVLPSEEDLIKKILKHFSKLLESNYDLILDPHAYKDKALQIGERKLEKHIREQHEKDMDFALRSSARAFMREDYKKVIELLYPYQPYLKSADLKKLEIAKAKIMGGSELPA